MRPKVDATSLYVERKRQARAFGMEARKEGVSLTDALYVSAYGQDEADLREAVEAGWRAEDRALARGKTAQE